MAKIKQGLVQYSSLKSYLYINAFEHNSRKILDSIPKKPFQNVNLMPWLSQVFSKSVFLLIKKVVSNGLLKEQKKLF